MRISELTIPNTRGEAAKILQQAGYKPVGKGSFSSVWGKPDDRWVIKLFRPADVAYSRFLHLVKAVPNEHFPIIRGQPMRLSKSYYGVRIERLSTPSPKMRNLVMACWDYLGALNMIDEFKSSKDKELINGLRASINTLRFNEPTLADALDLIHKYVLAGNEQIINDVSMQNIGMRDNTLVFMDPVATITEGIEPTLDDEKTILHDKQARMKPDIKKARYTQAGNISSNFALGA
jgi:hypothetical protein